MNKIIITGAAGFLGGRMSKFLGSSYSKYAVVGTSRRKEREEELLSSGCIFESGDLLSFDFCKKLTREAAVVVHCAALSSPYGLYEEFYASNVIASKNLLNASIENGVKKFIYISTPSIYVTLGARFNVKESDPLPRKMVNHYANTKKIAEDLILEANNKGIQTLALRPRAIIGAEDTVIFPRVLEAYHQGKLKIIGDGKNICDFTCVRNVIEAVIRSIEAPDAAYGEAYNITDDSPMYFWNALNYAFEGLGLAIPTKRVPKRLAIYAARIIELKAQILKEKKEPALSAYGVSVLADSFTLNIEKAKTYLGYKPVMSTLEGIKEYIVWHQKNRIG